METNKEIRTMPVKIEIRQTENNEKVLDGKAVVYNSPSEMSYGFTEVIEPGFFSGCLNDDVLATVEHNCEKLVGRTKSGTLNLKDTPVALMTENKIPDTSVGNDLLKLIERGDIQGMSFAFRCSESGQEWKTDPVTGITKRTLKSGGCERLFDITYTADPAYRDTSVAQRSLEKFKKEQEEKPDLLKEINRRTNERKRKIQLASL